MRKLEALLCVLAMVVLVSGCASAPQVRNSGLTGEQAGPAVAYDVPVLSGCLIADVTQPQTVRGSQVELGSKQGKATATSILGLIATGDNSVSTAARNGGITKVKTADVHVNSILMGMYTEVTTIVTGE